MRKFSGCGTNIVVVVAFLGVCYLVSEWLWSTPLLKPELPPPVDLHYQYRRLASAAVDIVDALPASRRDAIAARLQAAIIPLDQWLGRLVENRNQLICLGEIHTESTRRFIAFDLFEDLALDLLMLELTPEETPALLTGPLDEMLVEDVDMSVVVRAAQAANPRVAIVGVEESGSQLEQRKRAGTGSREDSIFVNVVPHLRPGQRQVVLYGARHCMTLPDHLYEMLARMPTIDPERQLLNVRIWGRHQHGAVEGFAKVAHHLGVEHETYVILDPESLYELELKLLHPLLETFRWFEAVIVFDDRLERYRPAEAGDSQ